METQILHDNFLLIRIKCHKGRQYSEFTLVETDSSASSWIALL